MDIFQILSNGDGKLGKRDALLAQCVLEDVDFALGASISELADRAGVSAPTVTRFCRRIGCSGYADFKVKLARVTYVGMRYLKPEVTSSTADEVAQDIVTKAQNALFRSFQQFDLPAMETAAKLLRGADFIQAFGSGGNSTMIAQELHNRLFRLGCRIHWSSDRQMDLMMAAAAVPGTVAIVSSMTGRDPALLQCLDIFRGNGMPTIALTQTGSPLAQAADVLIGIDLAEGKNIFRPTSTRYAYLAAIDIVANLVAYEDRETSRAMLRRVKEALVRNRDGDDRQLLGD